MLSIDCGSFKLDNKYKFGSILKYRRTHLKLLKTKRQTRIFYASGINYANNLLLAHKQIFAHLHNKNVQSSIELFSLSSSVWLFIKYIML